MYSIIIKYYAYIQTKAEGKRSIEIEARRENWGIYIIQILKMKEGKWP